MIRMLKTAKHVIYSELSENHQFYTRLYVNYVNI